MAMGSISPPGGRHGQRCRGGQIDHCRRWYVDQICSCRSINENYMGVSKNRGILPPKWMVKIMENPMHKWDDLG